ncbi:MAG: DUF115 domain-containing protein [Verrucomicrobia bacterium]|nr:DUF115 domain-containing protein [Verrucomicrobiota bacterium]MBS0636689.1 DUF115 domain-containing protein [Verrucomicrobiota bacterium]
MFDTCLQLFGRKNPKASALLAYVESRALQDDELSPIEPKSFEGVDFIALFGLGNGSSFFALQSWLEADANHQLILLEDDLQVILHFLESDNAKEILEHPQVHVLYIEDSEDGLQVLQSLAWWAYEKKMLLLASPYYETKRKKTFEDIKARLQYETSDIHLVLDEYVGYGASFFRNFWKNLAHLPGSYKANKLKGAFKGVPAIVVAAGPSLAKHLKQLEHLRDRALIFAGGSSVNALSDAAILPHFGAGIDPNPLQYVRFRQALAFQVPFFYRNRICKEALQLVEGPRLYLKGGDGYNISDWFEEKLKIPGSIIGGGHSVANFIIEIAHYLGCGPIILVGYDLAFGKELERYAPGVESFAEVNIDEPIEWTDIDGKKIHTAWKWLLEAKWIEDFAKAHPRMKIINATEGGLGLKNIPHKTLEEVAKSYLTKEYDLENMVTSAIKKCGVVKGELQAYCREMYESLERCKGYLDKLMDLAADDVHTILLQAEFKNEIGYRYILEVFDRMRAKLEYYELSFNSRASEAKLLKERYKFLQETAILNQLLIQQYQASEAGVVDPKVRIEDGVKKYYYDNGALKMELPYKEGVLQGKIRIFYPNGNIKREVECVQGRRDGFDRYFAADGTPVFALKYTSGAYSGAEIEDPVVKAYHL